MVTRCRESKQRDSALSSRQYSRASTDRRWTELELDDRSRPITVHSESRRTRVSEHERHPCVVHRWSTPRAHGACTSIVARPASGVVSRLPSRPVHQQRSDQFRQRRLSVQDSARLRNTGAESIDVHKCLMSAWTVPSGWTRVQMPLLRQLHWTGLQRRSVLVRHGVNYFVSFQ